MMTSPAPLPAGALCLAGLVALGGRGAEASVGPTASSSSRNVTVTLVPERRGLEAGRPLQVGVHLKLAPEWHTYWRNPGDAGLPIRIQWRLPPGFSAGEVQWPRPERFATGPLTSYGYSREALLLAEIRPPAAAAGGEVRIGARVDWLECKEACLPGRAELAIALPVVKGAPPPLEEWARVFERFRERLPRSGARLGAEAAADGPALTLTFTGAAPPGQAYFFPAEPEVVEHGAEQRVSPAGRGFRLRLARAVNAPVPKRIEGVLEADGEAYWIEAAVGSTPRAR